MNLIQACQDENLFKPWFRDQKTWQSWFTFIKALFGLPMDEADLATFTNCTGRMTAPTGQSSEGWIIAGRRSGKSFILSLIAVYLATFRDYREYLAPGEKATIMILACDKRQCRVIMRYIKALLDEVPLLKAMVNSARTKQDDMAFELEGRVVIEVHAGSFRSVRGYTCVGVLFDELAFWRSDESANPDQEILAAVRPALATVAGSMLLCASSPYSRRGALWQAHRRYYAVDGPVLIWQADTRTMNPTVAQAVIDEATERDPTIALSEWQAQFRSDLESYVDRAAVEACIEVGVRERPRWHNQRYAAFCDPSGGRQDSMTLAIGHREGDVVVLDVLRERRAPFDPQSVVSDFAETLRNYGVIKVYSDRYAGEWPTTAFRTHGIGCAPAPLPKSDLYRELLPVINSQRIVLLDNQRLVAQLVSLERRTGRAGKDTVDHPPGMLDDVSNAVAGLASLLAKPVQTVRRLKVLGV